jgi:uncharacterized protein
MPSTVLFVHSSGPQGPGEGSEPFFARLREELGPGYELLFPIMPEPENPHYAPWSKRLGEILDEAEEPLVVVGHSLGSSVVLKHLAESDRPKPITGLVLATTPFWGREEDWEIEWALPEDWPDASTKLPPTFLFHSRDDEVIPFDDLDRYARLLPGATVRALDGNGHLYDRGDLTEILAAIRSLAS